MSFSYRFSLYLVVSAAREQRIGESPRALNPKPIQLLAGAKSVAYGVLGKGIMSLTVVQGQRSLRSR